jgi:hypothetical protein
MVHLEYLQAVLEMWLYLKNVNLLCELSVCSFNLTERLLLIWTWANIRMLRPTKAIHEISYLQFNILFRYLCTEQL